MTKQRPASRTALTHGLERLSHRITQWAGSSVGFGCALTAIVLWAVTGPLLGFSDTWQLVINTATTVVTFLMVFLIQRSQNKDAAALHLKLNEIVGALEGASNRLINVEKLPEEAVQALHRHYEELVRAAQRDGSPTRSHSIEEARGRPHRTRPPA